MGSPFLLLVFRLSLLFDFFDVCLCVVWCAPCRGVDNPVWQTKLAPITFYLSCECVMWYAPPSQRQRRSCTAIRMPNRNANETPKKEKDKTKLLRFAKEDTLAARILDSLLCLPFIRWHQRFGDKYAGDAYFIAATAAAAAHTRRCRRSSLASCTCSVIGYGIYSKMLVALFIGTRINFTTLRSTARSRAHSLTPTAICSFLVVAFRFFAFAC